MIQRVLADLVVVLHGAFVVFVLAGGLLALRWRWAPIVHLPAALWGVYVELSGGVCPLTPLENALRRAAAQAGYEGGFVEHYLLPALYPAALSPSLQLALAGVVVVANAIVYGIVLRRRRRPARRAERSDDPVIRARYQEATSQLVWERPGVSQSPGVMSECR